MEPIKADINFIKGAVAFGKWGLSILISLVIAILALLSYVIANRSPKSTMITSDGPAVAQSQNAAVH